MSEDLTQFQTAGGRSTSKQLSMQATTPPSEVPGYRLQRFLGAGAFGQVWIGKDLNTGRGVAVKFYLHRGGVNWSLLGREVKNLVQLSADRYVVQVLEVGWDADPPYYVMELVAGGSLEQLLKNRPRLPVGEAVEIFQKICTGLNHCHAKGVLHCDIKPANILMAEDDEPRLADFGQSRMSHDQTPALGTLFYMAPEQADLNATPDAGWDVYGAGAILYRMLTGQVPHRVDTLVSEIDTEGSLPKRLQKYRESIENNPPATEHLKRRGVDRRLAAIVSRAIAADPTKRYANIQLILDDLRRRDQARAQRPLMLLGIVGPLLLLSAMCLFGWHSINNASKSTTEALRTEAFGSNKLAAKFAARTLENEVERYFTLTENEAARADLREQLEIVLRTPPTAELIQKIGSAASPADALAMREERDLLLDDPQRGRLDQLLAQRLSRYTEDSEVSRRPRLATMFITDSRGTIIGIAYEEEVSRNKSSVAKNYAYRTYFHGGSNDLDRNVPIDSIEPLRSTHLSSAFPSTATGLWKVAVSTPIFLTDDDQPDALFVVTSNLGDFQLLQSEQGANQIAVLVDARAGEMRGTILQHPLMDQRRQEGRVLASDRYQVGQPMMRNLLDGGDDVYRDPLSHVDDGAAYAGDWIAAMEPVTLPNDPDADQLDGQTTDLLVLVQYRLDKILAPVGQMKSSLLWEGAAAIGSILMLTMMLWLLAIKSKEPRDDYEEQKAAAEGRELVETVDAR